MPDLSDEESFADKLKTRLENNNSLRVGMSMDAWLLKRWEEEEKKKEEEKRAQEAEDAELFRRLRIQKQQGVWKRQEGEVLDKERLKNVIGTGSKRKRKGVKGTKKKRKRRRVKGVKGTKKKRKRRRVKGVRGTKKKR